MSEKKENKRMIFVLIVICIMFLALVIYINYFQIFKSEEVRNNPYNKRMWANEDKVERGSIYDRNGSLLAYNGKGEDSNKRYYNYGPLYSHVIGYSYREYGKSGLELSYNNVLLDIKESAALNDLKNIVLPKSVGNDLVLTIDHKLQSKSRELLKGKKGTVITMNPKNGQIYSMVSYPDFDLENLKEEWQNISESEDSPFLNRATQGLYTPGSIFKLITTSSFLETENINYLYTCNSKALIDGYEFNDYANISHGDIDLYGAFVNSCNPYYVEKVQEIGSDKLGKKAEDFLINKKIPFDLNIEKSRFDYSNLKKTKLAASSIGQGDVLVTPMNMLLVTSAIANDGVMMKPKLVKEIRNKNGKIIRDYKKEELKKSLEIEDAKEIKEMMRRVITSGTGKSASIKNIEIAGKTGTAENASGKTHSWFVGYSDKDNPKIAIIVLLEESGLTGAKGAAPIARDLIIYSYNNINFEEE